jgi:hypothetical protein
LKAINPFISIAANIDILLPLSNGNFTVVGTPILEHAKHLFALRQMVDLEKLETSGKVIFSFSKSSSK